MSTLKAQLFTADGNFTVPDGVSCIWVTAQAGGAPGGPLITHFFGSTYGLVHGGGGAGGLCMGVPMPVQSGEVIDIVAAATVNAQVYPWEYTQIVPGEPCSVTTTGATWVLFVGGGYPPAYARVRTAFADGATVGGGGGGGAGGLGTPVNAYNGYPGMAGSVLFYGGDGAAASWGGGTPGELGSGAGSANNHYGGANGSSSAQSGGGGGSLYGDGGAGGNYGPTPGGDGNPGTGYGAGGGGGGSTGGFGFWPTQPKGGNGIGGFVIIQWFG